MSELEEFSQKQLEYELQRRAARKIAERLAEGTDYTADDLLSQREACTSAYEERAKPLQEQYEYHSDKAGEATVRMGELNEDLDDLRSYHAGGWG